MSCPECEWYAKHCCAVMDDMGNVSSWQDWVAEKKALLRRIQELEEKCQKKPGA